MWRAAPRQVAVAALVAVLLAACGGQPKPVGEAVQTGGQLIMGGVQEAKGFHPYLGTDGPSIDYQALQYAGMTERDAKAELRGVLASDWRISDDQLAITINLKKDLKWSDGRPLTSEDVQWTFERFVDPKNNNPYLSQWSRVQSLKATSPTQLVLKLREVFAPLVDNLDFRVLPKHVWEKLNWADNPEITKPSIGSGPFLLEEWKRDDHAIFRANPNYVEGRPHLDRLIWKMYPNTTGLFTATKNGEVDLASVQPDNYLDAKASNLKLDEYFTVGGSIRYVGMNLTKPQLSDVRVRRAMTYALDRKTVIDKALNGLAVPLETWVVPKNPFYNKNVEKEPYNYNPARAKALLDEAGWRVGADGIREKDGVKLRMRYMSSTGVKYNQDVFTFYQQYWKDVGIDVRPDFVELQTLLQRLNAPARDYELWTINWGAGYDPDSSMQHWKKDSSFNRRSRYDNPRVDELASQATRTFDFQKRKALYDEIQEILHKDQPYIFGYVNKSVLARGPRVGGVEIGLLGYYHDQQNWFAKSKTR
jgi:peptide/nickel transport system substrate-binding protein